MNCLNRLQLQKHIDNELTEADNAEIAEHIKTCQSCRNQLNGLHKFIKIIKTELPATDLIIPPFNYKKPSSAVKKFITRRYLAGSVAAAAAFALIFLANHQPKEQTAPSIPVIQESEVADYDPNTLYNSATVVISKTEVAGLEQIQTGNEFSDPNTSYNRAEIEITIIN